MSLVKVAQKNQVPAGTMKSFVVGDKQILVANVEGKYYAINNICTHAGGNLSAGKLDGKIVTCPRHGSQFDVTTGICVAGPKIMFIRLKTKSEPAYRVVVEGENIKIDI